MAKVRDSISSKSLRAIKSNYIGTVVRIIAQFFSQILIMRELGPEQVGTFGYVLLLFGLLSLLIDQGFGWALIKGDFNDTEVKTVFSRLVLSSVLGMLFVFYISYPISALLNNELIGTVLRFSAPSALFSVIYSISFAKMRADFKFKEMQFALTGAYIIAYPIAGVSMAIFGFGIWSLLAAWYLQAILQVIIAYYYSPHPLRVGNPFKPTKSGPLGRQVVSINILNWAADNSGGIFVGTLGASPLGNFNASSLLARAPVLHLVQNLQSIIFSTASALDSENANINRLYKSAIAAISMLVVPVYAYFFTHSDFIISTVFGNKWSVASSLFSALSIGMISLALSAVTSSILTATGAEKTVFFSQIACIATMLTGFTIVLHMELVYVGFVISSAYTIRLGIQLGSLSKRNNIETTEFFRQTRGPLLLSVLIALPTPFLFFENSSTIAVEIIILASKIITSIIFIKLSPKLFLSDSLIEVLRRFKLGNQLLKHVNL